MSARQLFLTLSVRELKAMVSGRFRRHLFALLSDAYDVWWVHPLPLASSSSLFREDLLSQQVLLALKRKDRNPSEWRKSATAMVVFVDDD